MVKIHTLHGFLGKPSDWSFLPHAIHEELYGNIAPYKKWAKRFLSTVDANQTNYVAGYSLGGRLAMHALLENPSVWNGAIIVSAHPGLKDPLQRKARVDEDKRWANQFQEKPWCTLVDDWNQLPVFHGSLKAAPKESEHDRKALSEMLTTWSLGYQENLLPKVEQLEIPILWITGELDTKFSSLEIKLKHPKSQKLIATQTGHRVLLEQSKWIREHILTFIKETS